jgi:deazaflavin-dependent oxidoreductase (nitroreductase family)
MTTTRPSPPHGLSWQLARLTAPITRALAGRRIFPLWAVVHHIGRKTGRELTVPVAVRATPELFVVVLPWGPGTNWARNVLAAGGCVVRWKGADHRTQRPELVGQSQARAYYSRFEWTVTQRVFRAESFLLLHRSPGVDRQAS